jgi:hypothetical protein
MTISKDELQQVAQAVAQAIQGANQQGAQQTAQQIAEQVGQSVSQAISKVMQSQTQTTGATLLSGRAENADIGGSERLEKDNMDDSGILFANTKRTYDEYQHESLESIKRNRSYVDKILSDAHGYDMSARNIATQALQNAVETANMVGKQAVRHSDIAIDREWNVNESDYAAADILKSNTFKDAIQAAVASAVNQALGKTSKA